MESRGNKLHNVILKSSGLALCPALSVSLFIVLPLHLASAYSEGIFSQGALSGKGHVRPLFHNLRRKQATLFTVILKNSRRGPKE